jgi:hypothetical protein
MKKSELRQIIREEFENLSEISFSYMDRMEGMANVVDLQAFKAKLELLTKAWVKEGFEKDDVVKYTTFLINKIK